MVLSLNIKINKDLKEEILNLSCGSPRFIKKFFSNVYVNRSLKTLDYKMILIDTKNELSRYMQWKEFSNLIQLFLLLYMWKELQIIK